MSLRNAARRLIPATVRRSIKDHLGKPRWLHDNYALLRRIGPFHESHVILDIGACNGWFTECWQEYSPKAVSHCFEPSRQTFTENLRQSLGDRPNVHLNNLAIGREAEIRTLHTGASYASSSLYQLKASNVLELDLAETEDVQVIRMDDYLREHDIGSVRLVKIDVQGHELAVLEGFGNRLTQVDFIYVEVSIHPLYEQPATFCEVLKFLARNGFLLMAIKPNSLDGQFVQEADLLFGRKPLVTGSAG